ncbi:hypothetical protein [Methylobacterium sp. 37f]|uniref:hypothetical protein n=1 Tax=Methylobacterium sp. 37f TaxID=2817058 RepID=UPI001FFDCAA9|nr:hypothetical protein [Methylobacterium sp. 37f]MCK2056990.1 hypothetical protein [Methylobacterium sp. 37f]
MALYAHANVLKSIRLLAVEDGIPAPEALHRVMKYYFYLRGNYFEYFVSDEQKDCSLTSFAIAQIDLGVARALDPRIDGR